jgi:hypothetical protein
MDATAFIIRIGKCIHSPCLRSMCDSQPPKAPDFACSWCGDIHRCTGQCIPAPPPRLDITSCQSIPVSLRGESENREGGKAFRCPSWSCASVASWRCNCSEPSAKRPGIRTGIEIGSLERELWPLGVVPDGVTRSEADPLRNRAVLLLRFGKLLLGAEGFVALCCVRSRDIQGYSERRFGEVRIPAS